MVIKESLKLLAVLGLVFLFFQCGEKIKLPTSLPFSQDKALDTTYVQISPVWTEAGGIPFKEPQDVFIGYDTYIYIADTGNDRVVKMDRRGEFIDQYPVPHPIAVAQDPLLRLATVSGDSNIYLKDVLEERPFYLAFSFESERILRIWYPDTSDTIMDSTFYPPWIDTIIIVDTIEVLTDTVNTSIRAIAATPIPEGEYLFFTCDQTTHTYQGPYWEKHQRDQISGFVPRFQDTLVALKFAHAPVGKGGDLGQTIFPSGIFTYPYKDHFRIAFTQGYTPNSAQVLNGRTYYPVIPRTDSTELYFPAMFGLAEDVAVDEYDNIYVVDAGRHSVLKFNHNGRLLLRFGSFGSGNKEFKRPKGIAYYNKTLYVADSGNNRIVRFQLSTDIRK
jgi:DNA-binding beta-propeller fold protein YncE